MTPIGSRSRAVRAACWVSWSCCVACAPTPHAKPAPESPSSTAPPSAPAPAVEPAPAPVNEAAPAAPPPAAKEAPPAGAKIRAIHPLGQGQDCIEMYGTCTPPPDRLCTSSAFVLSCGESGRLPTGKREWLRCVCP